LTPTEKKLVAYSTHLATMILSVHYPPDYPDEPPNLELSATPNAPPYPYFNVADDKVQLLEALKETIDENLGMAMIFTLVSTLKESAEQVISDRQQAARAAHEASIAAAEAEENKKFHGTPVNKETFMKWQEQFRKEMEQEAREKEKEDEAERKRRGFKELEKKLTGKELWERGLAGKVDEEEEEDVAEDDLPADLGKLKVGAA
jgi:hypothetical protein